MSQELMEVDSGIMEVRLGTGRAVEKDFEILSDAVSPDTDVQFSDAYEQALVYAR